MKGVQGLLRSVVGFFSMVDISEMDAAATPIPREDSHRGSGALNMRRLAAEPL
jgi:hypothetical protein